MPNYISDDVKDMIGFETDFVVSCDLVEAGQIRRHAQATMDLDPLYYDEDYAAETRFGEIVAPPLFPLHAVTRVGFDRDDPLDQAAADPNFDCASSNLIKGCVALPVPLKKIINGGSEFELFRLARVGERIKAKSKYADIKQKEGKSGAMIFWTIETEYRTEDNELLLIGRNTRILR